MLWMEEAEETERVCRAVPNHNSRLTPDRGLPSPQPDSASSARWACSRSRDSERFRGLLLLLLLLSLLLLRGALARCHCS
jgi:hypothetical protein